MLRIYFRWKTNFLYRDYNLRPKYKFRLHNNQRWRWWYNSRWKWCSCLERSITSYRHKIQYIVNWKYMFEGLVISSCKMIILLHKISVDLILNSPNLTVHVCKKRNFFVLGSKQQNWLKFWFLMWYCFFIIKFLPCWFWGPSPPFQNLFSWHIQYTWQCTCFNWWMWFDITQK